MVEVLRVQSNRSSGFTINRAKDLLKEHDAIQLQGFGQASTVTLKAVSGLINYGYATLEKIETGHLPGR
jgi:hypothetical protein